MWETLYSIRTLNKQKPRKGKILIAEPYLPDYNFKRSVVLLCRHNNKEGTFGLILNKPMELKVNETINNFPEFDAPLYYGGPVESDKLFYIHTKGNLIEDSLAISDGVYIGGNFELIKQMIKNKDLYPHDIKFFIGYSGWAPYQLQQEIEMESWIVSDCDNQCIMKNEVENMWKDILRRMGKEYARLTLFPDDPTQN